MLLIKIGGGDAIDLNAVALDIATLNQPVLIVHGANALRDEIADQLGIEKEVIVSKSGQSSVKSTPELIDLMLMTYAGLRNKRIVELLQQSGVNAIGLSGIDGGLIQGKRNKGIRARQNGKTIIIRDESGKPDEINVELLQLLLQNNYIPVLTVPIMDENRKLINSENDDIVAKICQNMQISKVIMLIEEKGLLKDYNNPKTLINEIDHISLQKWEKEVEGRMKRKLYAIDQMLSKNGPVVIISDGRITDPVSNALRGKGTTINW